MAKKYGTLFTRLPLHLLLMPEKVLTLIGLLWLCYASSSAAASEASKVVRAVARSNATLECAGMPPPGGAALRSLEWRRGGETRNLIEHRRGSTTVRHNADRMTVLPATYSLFFNPVLSEDGGEYACVVNDATATAGGSTGPPVVLIVQDVPDPPGKPMILGFTSRSVNLSWTPSPNAHNSPITHYIIQLRVGEDGNWESSRDISTSTNTTGHQVISLMPYTVYSFRISAANAIGRSKPSVESYYIITLREVPDGKPTITSAHNTSDMSVRVEWITPDKDTIHGEFLGYRITYKIRDLPDDTLQEITLRDATALGYTIKPLKPFTQYLVSVQIFNPEGLGPATTIVVMTDEGVPSKPMNLRVVQVTNNMLKLEWYQPEHPNGVIQGYRLYYMHKNYTDVRTLRSHELKMEFVLTDLEPYRAYKIWLKAFTSKYEGEPSEMLTVWTDVEGPSPPQILNLTCQSYDSLYLQWQRPHLYYHQVDYYYVYYRSEKSWDFEQLAVESPNNREDHTMFIPNLTANTMYEVKVRGATRSLIERTHVYKGPFSDSRKVLLHPRCSRELSSYTASVSDADGVSAGMIAGLVCASFTLILAILALVLWRKCFQATYYYLDDPPPPKNNASQLNMADIYHESKHVSISMEQWAERVANLHADGDIGFSKEYEAIQQATACDLPAEQSQTSDNKAKNRYLNIVAYDHSRVSLRPLPGQKKISDYINANYIDGYYKPKAYIGTQGPLPSTFSDFWRMVWEQRVAIIVMITNLIERGRRKCDMYWPKEGMEAYGFIQVKLMNETVLSTYTIRTFKLKNLKVRKKHQCERTVYQYHYTNWPDHGVPEHPLPILSFVRKSAAANPDDAGPIIVHCSAGVGRTGTYIVLDAMLRQIKHNCNVNVYGFLNHIRNQRNYLVQTEEQYIFIHDALLEAIESGETEVGLPYFGRYLQSLQTSADGERNSVVVATQQNDLSRPLTVANINSNSTYHHPPQHTWQLLDRQFKLVTAFVPKDFQLTAALKPCNASKNRGQAVLPVEAYRVHITTKPGIEGSDYVNATFLQGFHKLREFIVTQHPLQNTVSDFWQMVWDHNVQTIVLISPVDDQHWEPFWPYKNDPLISEVFSAKLSGEAEFPSYETKDFVMHSNQDDYELVCRMIYWPNWPEGCSPLSATFDLIKVVQQRFADNNNGPVVVVDRYGGTEAATFCCLTTLFNQVEFEPRVDVYQYAKLYHLRRPGIWKSQDDYLHLYRAVESLTDSSHNSVVAPPLSTTANNTTAINTTMVNLGHADSDSRHSLNGHANGHLPNTTGASTASSRSSMAGLGADSSCRTSPNHLPQYRSLSPLPPPSSSAASSPVPRTPTLPSPSSVSLERIMLAGNGSPV